MDDMVRTGKLGNAERTLLDTVGCPTSWILLDTTGYYWIVLDTTGYWWILLLDTTAYNCTRAHLVRKQGQWHTRIDPVFRTATTLSFTMSCVNQDLVPVGMLIVGVMALLQCLGA